MFICIFFDIEVLFLYYVQSECYYRMAFLCIFDCAVCQQAASETEAFKTCGELPIAADAQENACFVRGDFYHFRLYACRTPFAQF